MTGTAAQSMSGIILQPRNLLLLISAEGHTTIALRLMTRLQLKLETFREGI